MSGTIMIGIIQLNNSLACNGLQDLLYFTCNGLSVGFLPNVWSKQLEQVHSLAKISKSPYCTSVDTSLSYAILVYLNLKYFPYILFFKKQ